MTNYLYDCLYCGYPTKHPSKTCPAHRDLAPPIPGLDVPFEGEVVSRDDVGRHPPRRAPRSRRASSGEAGLDADGA